MKKIVRYVLIFMITFFIGNISAKAEVTMCEYKFPFTGLSYHGLSRNELQPGDDFAIPWYSYTVDNQYFTVKFQTSNTATIVEYTNYKGKSPYNLKTTKEFDNYIANNNKCPEYINVHKKNLHAVIEPSDKNAFLENIFSYNNATSDSDVPIIDGHDFIIPLYQSTMDGKTNFSNSGYDAYIQKTISVWTDFIDILDSSASSACGSKWSDYKKYSNYSDEIETPDKFLEYAMSSSYPAIKIATFDTEISSDCWFSRIDYMSAIKNLSIYVKSIGDDTNISKITTQKYLSSFNKLNNYLKLVGKGSEAQEKTDELQAEYDKKEELMQNKCSAYCINMSGTAKTECEKSATYQKCYSCYYTNNPCSSYSGIAETECMKSYSVKDCMGEDAYNNLQKQYDSLLEEINDKIEKIRYELKKIINSPTLTGIEFEPYKVKCEDFSILHKFWRIITIVAPILTILFGILDYAFAVIASNEEKMSKAKKKFPKRLVAALILLVIPVLISILVNIFTVSNNDDMGNVSDTSILKCIVNGE